MKEENKTETLFQNVSSSSKELDSVTEILPKTAEANAWGDIVFDATLDETTALMQKFKSDVIFLDIPGLMSRGKELLNGSLATLEASTNEAITASDNLLALVESSFKSRGIL